MLATWHSLTDCDHSADWASGSFLSFLATSLTTRPSSRELSRSGVASAWSERHFLPALNKSNVFLGSAKGCLLLEALRAFASRALAVLFIAPCTGHDSLRDAAGASQSGRCPFVRTKPETRQLFRGWLPGRPFPINVASGQPEPTSTTGSSFLGIDVLQFCRSASHTHVAQAFRTVLIPTVRVHGDWTRVHGQGGIHCGGSPGARPCGSSVVSHSLHGSHCNICSSRSANRGSSWTASP